MKTIQNPIIRSIFTIILGLILIKWPDTASDIIVQMIGVVFLIPGVISMFLYLFRKRKSTNSNRSFIPIEGIGSILLGLCLILIPDFFVGFLMYVLGFVLILAAIFQILNLATIRKSIQVPLLFYIIPALILITGVIILFNPFQSVATILLLFGIGIVAYGIMELIDYYRFK